MKWRQVALAGGVAATVVAATVSLYLRRAGSGDHSAQSEPPSSQPSATAVVPSPTTSTAAPPRWPLDDGWRGDDLPPNATVEEQRAYLYAALRSYHGFTESQLAAVQSAVRGSRWLAFGAPGITRHPMSRSECREVRRGAHWVEPDQSCPARNMVRLPRAEGSSEAATCIDQYEFPNIPCEYPVTWVRASTAQKICHAWGKRLCDAHEWEDGCAGKAAPREERYDFQRARLQGTYYLNKDREVSWAYGPEQDLPKCATGAIRSPNCWASEYEKCGSNTFPAGAFPACVSSVGVYDQHGNAAEIMNFPRAASEFGAHGGEGVTELKGSWFVFQQKQTHLDDCRWRAPAWHETRISDPDSHGNYHLGFRCCADLPAPSSPEVKAVR